MKRKKGIASFYIVAFSTLILTVIAVSFSAIIVSQITKTSDDDLSQSAYDSALAGIEDAKLAYYNYQRCLESGMDVSAVHAPAEGTTVVNCNNIVYWMQNPSCDMVAKILGRGLDENNDVLIQETSIGGKNMQQAYTCVKINTKMNDYRSSLNSDNMTRVVQVRRGDVETIRISWYSNRDGAELAFTNFSGGKVIFPSLSVKAATPPTISVGLVQTAEQFSLSDFEKVEDNRTDRGVVFLTPTEKSDDAARKSDAISDNYLGVFDGKDNVITAEQIAKSNDRTLKNVPYAVYCGKGKEFACSATLKLPGPIFYNNNGLRDDDTFMIVVSIPYGQPSTDFALEFCTDKDECDKAAAIGNVGMAGAGEGVINLEDVQVEIDSTGRANDLYRRVVARMDSHDTYFPYPLYALELLGNNGAVLKKDMTVTSEYDF